MDTLCPKTTKTEGHEENCFEVLVSFGAQYFGTRKGAF